MKTFKDLVFKAHENTRHFDTRSVMEFDNGYGVSIITGEMAYSSEAAPYELAILHKGEICYHSGITEDVIGRLTADEVSEIMIKVQSLPVSI